MPTTAAWLPPALVFVVAVFAFNGFFIPDLDADYLTYSVSLALANIGLPGLVCVILAHVRARRALPASTLKSADVATH